MKTNHAWNYEQAFSRNLGLINNAEQQVLRSTRVGIAGLGGVGGIHATTLARLGIANFTIADNDVFELVNTNRQYGAFSSTLGQSKTDVMSRFIRDINPEATVCVINSFLNQDNVREFVQSCDIVVDSLDAFALDARILLFKVAYELKVPVISAGPIGFSAAMLIQMPDGMDLSTYLAIKPSMSQAQKFVRFFIGLTPKPHFLKYMDRRKINVDEHGGQGPSINSATTLCAAVVATEILKIVLQRGKVKALPYYHYYDPYLGLFQRKFLWLGNRNPLQIVKYYFICRYILSK